MLVIDDEERILTALKSRFRSRYHVFTTADGNKALDFMRKYPMHVIVSDQRMPVMAGVELLRQSREISPRSVRILLTGYSDLAAMVGSINLAPGSLDGRRELAIEVRSDDVVDRLHKVAKHDWEHSHALDLSDEGLLADLAGRIEGGAQLLALDGEADDDD